MSQERPRSGLSDVRTRTSGDMLRHVDMFCVEMSQQMLMLSTSHNVVDVEDINNMIVTSSRCVRVV